jgi:hypothetical protein
MRLFCACHWAAFADLSTIDHGSITGTGHIRMMDSKSKPLITREEFGSLLVIGNPSAITDLPSVIPAQHRARLIALGLIADLSGRLQTTTLGRSRIAAGFENTPLLD